MFSDESEQDLTTQVDWSTDDGFVAFINNSGEATGVSEGETQVSASLDGEMGTAELTVTGGGTPGP